MWVLLNSRNSSAALSEFLDQIVWELWKWEHFWQITAYTPKISKKWLQLTRPSLPNSFLQLTLEFKNGSSHAIVPEVGTKWKTCASNLGTWYKAWSWRPSVPHYQRQSWIRTIATTLPRTNQQQKRRKRIHGKKRKVKRSTRTRTLILSSCSRIGMKGNQPSLGRMSKIGLIRLLPPLASCQILFLWLSTCCKPHWWFSLARGIGEFNQGLHQEVQLHLIPQARTNGFLAWSSLSQAPLSWFAAFWDPLHSLEMQLWYIVSPNLPLPVVAGWAAREPFPFSTKTTEVNHGLCQQLPKHRSGAIEAVVIGYGGLAQ